MILSKIIFTHFTIEQVHEAPHTVMLKGGTMGLLFGGNENVLKLDIVMVPKSANTPKAIEFRTLNK